MAWYEAHQTLAKHPKTLALTSLLKCDRRYAVGLLHDLFSWGLDSARKDGSLPGLNEDSIAMALDFTGQKGRKVVAALLESGYLEKENGTFKIHDWYDYAGKLADRREADKQRKNKKSSDGNPQEIRRKSDGEEDEIRREPDGQPAEIHTLPYPTVPCRTNITGDSVCDAHASTREETEAGDRWQEFWTAYPRKSGGDIRTACMEYLRIIGDGQDPEVLIQAAKELAARTEPQNFRYLPAAEKWLRNKGWLEKPQEIGKQTTNNPFLRKILQESEAPA